MRSNLTYSGEATAPWPPEGPPPACTTQTGWGIGPEWVGVTLLGREESSCPCPWEPSALGLDWGS